MSARSFPSIKPSGRSFDIGSYPEAVFEAQNGAKSYIRYGNKRVNANLTLSFTNIKDEDAALILKNYMTVDGGTDDYVIFSSSNALTGMGGSGEYSIHDWVRGTRLHGQADVTDGMRWRYNGSPKVSSVQPGISNVTCSFVGCLDGS